MRPLRKHKRAASAPLEMDRHLRAHKNFFQFSSTQSYQVRFTDFGAGGIKLDMSRESAPYWDRHTATMLASPDFDRFLCWASKTVGRPAMSLPLGSEQAFKRILDYLQKRRKRLPKADVQILEEAIQTLDCLNARGTGREIRALRR